MPFLKELVSGARLGGDKQCLEMLWRACVAWGCTCFVEGEERLQLQRGLGDEVLGAWNLQREYRAGESKRTALLRKGCLVRRQLQRELGDEVLGAWNLQRVALGACAAGGCLYVRGKCTKQLLCQRESAWYCRVMKMLFCWESRPPSGS